MMTAEVGLIPPFASTISTHGMHELAGRKGWGTHGVVSSRKVETLRLPNPERKPSRE